MQDFNAQDFVETLWTMAETSRVRPEVFDAPCLAAAAKVQDFNAQDLVETLWTMAETSRVRPEVFDSPCLAAAAKVQDFNAQDGIEKIHWRRGFGRGSGEGSSMRWLQPPHFDL